MHLNAQVCRTLSRIDAYLNFSQELRPKDRLIPLKDASWCLVQRGLCALTLETLSFRACLYKLLSSFPVWEGSTQDVGGTGGRGQRNKFIYLANPISKYFYFDDQTLFLKFKRCGSDNYSYSVISSIPLRYHRRTRIRILYQKRLQGVKFCGCRKKPSINITKYFLHFINKFEIEIHVFQFCL